MRKKRLKALILGGLLLFSGQAFAQELREAIANTRQDIQKAVLELNTLRQAHSKQLLALSKDITTLENQVLPLRKKVGRVRELVWQKESGFQQLQQETGYLQEEVNFCASLLVEYRREMATRMNLAEIQYRSSRLAKVDQSLDSGQAVEILSGAERLLTLIEYRNQENASGLSYVGQAIDSHGKLQDGYFLQIGPIHFFMNKEQTLAGMVGLKLGSANPTLVSEVSLSALKKLLRGEETQVPIDVTLGGAVKIARQKKSWFEHIRSGGIVMIPILGLGILCFFTAIWKFINLRKLQLDVEPVLTQVLRLVNQGQHSEAQKMTLTLGQPVAPVLYEGVEHSCAPREQIEEIMHEQILAQIPFLEKYLALLAVSAAVAPLLGLLGTVTGMVHTFDLVAVFGTGKVNILSSGISEALVTTEYGLIVAIPTLLIHAFLSRRVKRIIHTLEQTTVAFVNGLRVKKKK
ncbi:MotA/TolQ/ExbB proton channel family protein [bacterium]|nr:MotA/TolQ/ExbB proton channel family protein [bacterium]